MEPRDLAGTTKPDSVRPTPRRGRGATWSASGVVAAAALYGFVSRPILVVLVYVAAAGAMTALITVIVMLDRRNQRRRILLREAHAAQREQEHFHHERQSLEDAADQAGQRDLDPRPQGLIAAAAHNARLSTVPDQGLPITHGR